MLAVRMSGHHHCCMHNSYLGLMAANSPNSQSSTRYIENIRKANQTTTKNPKPNKKNPQTPNQQTTKPTTTLFPGCLVFCVLQTLLSLSFLTCFIKFWVVFLFGFVVFFL